MFFLLSGGKERAQPPHSHSFVRRRTFLFHQLTYSMKSPKPTQPRKDGNSKGVEKKTKKVHKNTKKTVDKSKQSLASKAKEIKQATDGKSQPKKSFKSNGKGKDGFNKKNKGGAKDDKKAAPANDKKYRKPFQTQVME